MGGPTRIAGVKTVLKLYLRANVFLVEVPIKMLKADLSVKFVKI